MGGSALTDLVRPYDPHVIRLAEHVPAGIPAAAALALLRSQLAHFGRRRGTGSRPIDECVRHGTLNCVEHVVLVLSALRHLDYPAAGVIANVVTTAPVLMHSVVVVRDGAEWHVSDVDRPAVVPWADVLAGGRFRPLVAWTEERIEPLYGDPAVLDRLYEGSPTHA